MTREFQVIYRPTPEKVERLLIYAQTAEEASAVIGGGVVSVKEARVVIEAGQAWFRLEEAAEYLRCSVTALYEGPMAEGRLARAKNGEPLFARKDLDRIAAEGIGKGRKKQANVDFKKAA